MQGEGFCSPFQNGNSSRKILIKTLSKKLVPNCEHKNRSFWAIFILPETKYGICVNSLATDDPRGANKIVQGPEEGGDEVKSRMGPEDKPKLHKCDQDHLEGQAQCQVVEL